jgi:hypothetical protein
MEMSGFTGMKLRDAQLKTIFEMLVTLIDDDKYDFSHAKVLFKPSTDEYNKLVDDNFKADYSK